MARENRGDTRGTEMFSRFAYAPNHLGYCGPEDAAALREGSSADVRALARGFTGAWPYLEVMARMTGIADPLDHRLVASYWLGGGIGARLDAGEFAAELLEVIAPVAGRYWQHLRADIADEAAPNHCFHVFGVYPWSRLLGSTTVDIPMRVLDDCRISWGRVLTRQDDDLVIECRRLGWDGRQLRLTEPRARRVPVWIDGYSAVPDAAPGDTVAIHWNHLCARLDSTQVRALTESTGRQLDLTNRRLARAAPPPSPRVE
ncbi:DUF6390 family protein [Nocardia brevicatena]|uniref:DUF6390 family protein n=1 Tax=Nocardia brevicatena TaxID=37327 RepID=UPI000593C233|nr:DUF6390 family protein [Nocardia brevicatena]